MIKFNKIMMNQNYFIREEDDQVVFFSGITRYIHFISKEAYKFLKIAETASSEIIYTKYCEDEEDRRLISAFFEELCEKNIITLE